LIDSITSETFITSSSEQDKGRTFSGLVRAKSYYANLSTLIRVFSNEHNRSQ